VTVVAGFIRSDVFFTSHPTSTKYWYKQWAHHWCI